MDGNLGEILKVIGYITATVILGLICIAIKEAVGGIFEIAIIVIGWISLIWFLIKTN